MHVYDIVRMTYYEFDLTDSLFSTTTTEEIASDVFSRIEKIQKKNRGEWGFWDCFTDTMDIKTTMITDDAVWGTVWKLKQSASLGVKILAKSISAVSTAWDVGNVYYATCKCIGYLN